jgi:hypothetical protein
MGNAYNMEDKTNFDIAWAYQIRLIEIYRSQNLRSLHGLDGEQEINGENILQSYVDARLPMHALQ